MDCTANHFDSPAQLYEGPFHVLEPCKRLFLVEPAVFLILAPLDTVIFSLSHALLELKDILERKHAYDSPASQVNAFLSLMVHYQGK